VTPQRDYLAGSWVAGWVRAVARFCRRQGNRIVRKVIQDPALSSLLAAFHATPLKVLGILMVAAAVMNWVTLQLLEKPLSGWGIVLRCGLVVFGVVCLRRKDSWEKIQQGSWIFRVLRRSA